MCVHVHAKVSSFSCSLERKNVATRGEVGG